MWNFKEDKKRICFVLGMLVILLLILVLCISKEKVLVVKDLDTETSTNLLLLPDQSFILGYTHSVLLTPAEEYFVIGKDNKLLLQKTIYESFGVGLPYLQENDWDFEIDNGKFILYVNREFKEINMVISAIPNHWIGIGDDRFNLVDIIASPEDKIKIFAKEAWIFKLGSYFYTF